MRNSKKIAMVIAGITVLGTMVCPVAAEEGATRLVTDVFGREVEIPEEVENCVALGSAARLIVYAGGTEKISVVRKWSFAAIRECRMHMPTKISSQIVRQWRQVEVEMQIMRNRSLH